VIIYIEGSFGLDGYLIWDVLKDRPFYLYLPDLAKTIIENLLRKLKRLF